MNRLDVKRTEDKYIVSKIDALKIQKKMDSLLSIDENSKNKIYVVKSLYFDSINDIDYNDKLCGRFDRKKIRLRLYGNNSELCKLEVKKKIGDLQNKISIWISIDDAKELIKGNYKVLFNYFDDENAIYIYKTMILGCYRPKVLVEYDRIAYTFSEFNTRITFDFNIKSSETNFNLFANKHNYNMIYDENIIMEVKYDNYLVNFISKILNDYNLKNVSFSKYLLARKVFNSFD